MKKLLASLLCFAILISLAACATENKPAEAPASAAPSTSAAAESSSAPAEEKFVIGYASKSSTTPFWVLLNKAIQDNAAALGVEVIELGPPKENDIAGQLAVIEDLLARDVDALIVAPCDDVGVAPAVKKFIDAGKPVIAVDNGVTGTDITSLVATNNMQSSAAAAEFLAKQLGGKGNVVTVDGIVAQGTGKDRKEGFVNYLAENYPDIKVVSSIAADWVDDAALRGVEDLINGNVEFDALFAAWDGGALAANQAIKNTGKEVIICGHDAYEEACKLMAANDPIFKGSVAQNPVNMGKLAVETTVKALKGEAVEKVIDSGSELVTSENAQAYFDKTYK